MRTLAPSQEFLRVSDKFFARHALYDRELKSGATLLYLLLYALCGKQDHCWPSQTALAALCKCSERSIQEYLKELAGLGYIRQERQGAHNVYRLLRSPRVLDMAELAGMNLVEADDPTGADFPPVKPGQTQILPVQGAEFSYDLRSLRSCLSKEINTPLSPLPQPTPGILPHCRGCSPRSPSRSGRGESPHVEGKRVDKTTRCPQRQPLCQTPRQSSCQSQHRSQDEFVHLWQAWPLKQDRYDAYREYAKLLLSGVLPPLDELLAMVARLKSEDRHWLNGYIPNLKFWLRGRRWQDEPFSGMKPSQEVVDVPPSSAPSLAPRVADFARPFHPVQKLFSDTVEQLTTLWPEIPKGCVSAGLLLARDQLFSLAGRMKNLSTAYANAPAPVPEPPAIAHWIREVVA